METVISESGLQNKDKLREILREGVHARFKNDVSLMKTEPYVINGSSLRKHKQYPLGELEENIGEIIKELE